MKLIKFIVIILVLLLAAISGVWYYATNHVANEINTKYAGQKFAVKGIDKNDYFITFDKAVPAGFPFKISWEFNGWAEESRSAKISYSSPIKLGYDLLLQQIFVSYDGEIKSAYKPEKHGFGSKIKVNDYNIKVDLPLSRSLVDTLKNMQDPVEIVNHLGSINVSSKKVEIFDLIDDEKFYDKEYERLKLTFVPQKEYKTLEDLLANIPQHYTVDYIVKMHPMKATPRRLPVSLFYGFSALPSGIDMAASAVIKTAGNNIDEIKKGLDIKADIVCDSSYANIQKFKILYKAGNDVAGRDYVLDTNSKIHVKAGMFDEIFSSYNRIALQVIASPVGRIVDKEIQYIIANKDKFRFKDLENSDYDFNLKMNSSFKQNKIYVKLDDFSVFSKDSGFKLQHEMETEATRDKKWFAKGLLYVKNYPEVIDFTSGYIYRFGKFRFLSEEARALYVDVNTEFLKSISDHPDSTSNDLSFEYLINSKNLDKMQFGSVQADKILQLYTLMLYKKLFGKVGHGGDVLSRMQEIIPDINANDPILQQILPKISGDAVGRSIQKEIDKALPSDAKKAINKLLPKGVFNGKDLLKNLNK
ncbi:MAG: hypothetical protein NWS20_00405 [Rickettsiaceae bacterium]|nr:hypothetical protein [Rickettsiaceae bacterium]MDP4832771.1 hypothetical protein [Rickettsiaceae bacterium]MDP5020663.1 hypothetical protein [Rickettsiaceae bacterium]MDP5083639.1 hypothetical protein [Rickettsiaceae bacterium]